MVAKTTTMERGNDVSFSSGETAVKTDSLVFSSGLTGVMLLIIITLVASLLHSAATMPRTSDVFTSPRMVSPQSTTTPGAIRVRGGDEQALDSIAGVPDGAGSGSIDSRISTPKTVDHPASTGETYLVTPAPL